MSTPYAEDSMEGYVGPERRKMPDDRDCITHKVEIGSPPSEGYIIAGVYEDGTLGEMFLHGFGQDGSTLDGWTNAFAIMFSIGVQYGAPLDMLARKFAHMKFEPYGSTNNTEIPYCHSVPDYIFKWLARRFGDVALVEELARIDREMRRT